MTVVEGKSKKRDTPRKKEITCPNLPNVLTSTLSTARLSETYPWSFEELLAQLAKEQIDQEFRP